MVPESADASDPTAQSVVVPTIPAEQRVPAVSTPPQRTTPGPSAQHNDLAFSRVETGPIDRGVWFCDEMRLGLHGQVRRVWAPIGVKVEQVVQIVYRWSYVIVAVNPVAGAVRWAWLPNMKGESIAPVVAEWKQQGGLAAMVWDGAPGHRSPLVRGCEVPLIALPSYSPELDPAERIFRAIRPEIEGEVYADLADKRAKVDAWLQAFAKAPERIRSLTAWPWLVPQIAAARSARPP